MSTVPPIVNELVSAYKAAPQELHKISSYIKAHERLIILILCLVAGVHFYSKVLGFFERHDERVSDTAHAVLQAQVAADKTLADTNAAAAAQYKQLATQLATANAALSAAQAARDKVTKDRQAIDRQLPPPGLIVRWAELLHFAPGKVVYKESGAAVDSNIAAFLVAPDAAQETVAQLEQIPTLQADLKDSQQIGFHYQQEAESLTTLNQGLNKQIDGLTIELNDQERACKADAKVAAAKARKGKLKWFGGGYVAGLATRALAKAFLGI